MQEEKKKDETIIQNAGHKCQKR